jgi:hypothetical protein
MRSINVLNWVLFFAFIIVYFVGSVAIFFWSRYKLLDKNVKDNVETRVESIHTSLTYLVVFTLYWVVAGAVWIAVYVNKSAQTATTAGEDSTGDVLQERPLAYLLAVTCSSLGIVDCIVWAFTHRHILMKLNKLKYTEMPSVELSESIRYNFIKETSEGIQKAVACANNPDSFRQHGCTHHAASAALGNDLDFSIGSLFTVFKVLVLLFIFYFIIFVLGVG